MGLEVAPHDGAHVVGVLDGGEEVGELEELRVLGVVEPGLDGDAVVHLVPEGVGRVVDKDRLREVPPQHVEVLEVVALDQEARVPEQPVLDELPLRVDYVQERVRVNLRRRGS